jgi:hypothetical protein
MAATERAASATCPKVLVKPPDDLVERHGAEIFSAAGPYRDAARFHLAVTDNDQIRYPLQRMLANLKADLLVSQVCFGPKALILKAFRD